MGLPPHLQAHTGAGERESRDRGREENGDGAEGARRRLPQLPQAPGRRRGWCWPAGRGARAYGLRSSVARARGLLPSGSLRGGGARARDLLARGGLRCGVGPRIHAQGAQLLQPLARAARAEESGGGVS